MDGIERDRIFHPHANQIRNRKKSPVVDALIGIAPVSQNVGLQRQQALQVHEAFWDFALPVNNSDVVSDELTNLRGVGIQTSQALFDGAAVEPALATSPGP